MTKLTERNKMKLSLLKCPSYRCLLLEERHLYFANSNLFALHFYTQKYVINRSDNRTKKALKHEIKQDF